jgi:hypothetical protein
MATIDHSVVDTRKRRRLRLTLWMVGALVVAVVCSVCVTGIRRYQRREAIISRIESLHGFINDVGSLTAEPTEIDFNTEHFPGIQSVLDDENAIALLEDLKQLKSMESLDLSGTAISDAAIAKVCELDQLSRLRIARTRITDRSMQDLSRMHHLRFLDISNTSVSPEAGAALRRDLTGTGIRMGKD